MVDQRQPGQRRSRPILTAAMTIALLVAACSGSADPTAPGASGASNPGQGAGSSGPNASGPIPAADVPAELVEALADPSRQRAAAVGEALDARIDEQIGLVAALGPDVVGWLTDRRSDAYRSVLEDQGVDTTALAPRRLSTEPIAAAGPAAAGPGDVAFGMAWFGASIMAPLYVGVGMSQVGNGNGQLPTQPTTSVDTRTEDGKVIKDTTTIDARLTISGATVRADVQLIQRTDVSDAATGAAIGSSTGNAHIIAEVNACPNPDGEVELTLTIDLSNDAAGLPGGSSFTMHSDERFIGHVDDDAWLVSADETATMDYTVTPPSGPAQTGSGTRAFTHTYGPGGGRSTITAANSTVGQGTMDPNESVKWQTMVLMTSMIARTQVMEEAQKTWRTSGKCVEIKTDERSRTVDPDEQVQIEARLMHVFDGNLLTKPIVATLSGTKTVLPAGEEQDSPAPITYIASSTTGAVGTVTMKSTSNRGIANLDLRFTVAPPIVVELEIESTITVTKLAGLRVVQGTAKAEGRIRLDESTENTWFGEGLLDSTTSSRAGGCQSVKVSGQGAYDWRVNEVIAGPDVPANEIVANMDAGSLVESPDRFVANLCTTSTSGTMNTWENLFFDAHRDQFLENGFRVDGWTLVATPDTWVNGGPIAEARWTGACKAMIVQGIAVTPVACTTDTTFRLNAIQAPPP